MRNRNGIFQGFAWKFIERISVQFGRFLIQLILARILVPEEYGLIAILTVFIVVADVIVQSGLNTALIQKKDVDSLDYSTVLISSILLSLVMYMVLLFASPYIAEWYSEPQLEVLLRVLALNLFSGAIYSVQIAYISKELNFKYNFYSTAIAIGVSGILGITMALMGFGIWSMIAQQLVNQTLASIILAVMIRRIPMLHFSFKRLKVLFSFGWKVLVSSIVATITENVYNIVMGKFYNTEIAGYYTRGHQFPTVICSSANSTISGVFFPMLSQKQDSIQEVKAVTRMGVMTCSYVLYPLLVGLLVIAEPLVKVLLTDKWLPCVPFLRLECLFYLTLPTVYVESQAIKALGKSGLCMFLELLKSGITLIGVFALAKVNLYFLVAFRTFVSFCILLVQIVISKKVIGYSIIEHIKDIKSGLVLSAITGIIVYSVTFLKMQSIYILIIQIFTGIIVYITISIASKNPIFDSIIKKLKSLKEE
jgi:O-antigen/teichoic acid export membrane protein